MKPINRKQECFYYLPDTIEQAISILGKHKGKAKIIAGGTDLMVEERKFNERQEILVDVTRIPQLHRIEMVADQLVIGAAVAHARLATSPIVNQYASVLAQACWQIGSPQVRNLGTIGGNLGTASPSGDCLPPLAVLNAQIEVVGKAGVRLIPFTAFMKGPKQTCLQDDELITSIRVTCLNEEMRSVFLKQGLRLGRSISVTSVAVVLDLHQDEIREARIALGAVSPRIQRSTDAETYLHGRSASPGCWEHTAKMAAEHTTPITDIRGSLEYRKHVASILTNRALEMAATQETPIVRSGAVPFVLGNPEERLPSAGNGLQPLGDVIVEVNGQTVHLSAPANTPLLHALRDSGHFTGVKEGCAEGECGACTVILDGQAILSCLVPCGAAFHRKVTTIEGLAAHPTGEKLKQAFIKAGAVQCGYCTPGLLMATTALLENIPNPDRGLIREAISGNLCRCTGYETVVEAVNDSTQAKGRDAL